MTDQEPRPRRRLAGDEMLKYLADQAQHGAEIELTVTAAGTVISGILIGQDKSLGLLPELVDENKAGARQFLTDLEDFALPDDQPLDDDEQEAERIWRLYQYLHLRDAAILAGPTMSGGTGMMWRVRIDQVSAWSLGLMANLTT
jgi:hypothetical protein